MTERQKFIAQTATQLCCAWLGQSVIKADDDKLTSALTKMAVLLAENIVLRAEHVEDPT